MTAAEAPAPFTHLVILELEAGDAVTVELLEHQARVLCRMRIVAVAARYPRQDPFSELGLFAAVGDMKVVEAPLPVPEAGRSCRGEILLVALPAEGIELFSKIKISLQGIGLDEEARPVRAVGGMAGAARAFLDGGVDRLSPEAAAFVAAEAELRLAGAEEMLPFREVRLVAAGAPSPREGGVKVGKADDDVVAFGADPAHILAYFPSLAGGGVAGGAVALGEGFVLEGVEKLVPPRGVGVVALGAFRLPEGVVPVRRPRAFALEIVAAGAEAVFPIEEDEPVVGAVIEVAGAAVAFPHGEVDVALCKALDFPLVTGKALAVDGPFEVRRGDDGRRGRDRGRPGIEGGDGWCGRGRAVAGVDGRPVAAGSALTAVGPLVELQLQAGDAAAVE